MRSIALSLAVLLSSTALAAPHHGHAHASAGASPTVVADANAPKGKLPDTVTPRAYRLDFTILPEAARFSGHDEIDVTINRSAKSLYMHGRDLVVSRAAALVNGRTVPAKWTQVDKTGTARLDFAQPLPTGKATLRFDYSAPFGDSASGMFHVKVDDKWYAWTQFESIDARAAYPGFDEPGFKTPFTVSVKTHPGLVVVGNAPEVSVTKAAGGLELHRLAPTKPLPTYLVAIDTGPFVHLTGTIPPDAERSWPMPYGAVATQAQEDKMGFVMAETPRIVGLLERYFGQPFPFPKLDQIGTPIMPGAMENAGADTYGDGIIFLRPGATTDDKQAFGMVVSHELSHQWFGDLVTPAWWDDIWLNESFANWMGFRIGNEWRPDLAIGVNALDEGFSAMNTDALLVGRPIHQPINQNSEIDSAFDSITYGKGGQVVAMIAAYLGDEKFKQGVRLHLNRHRYGNATSDQFFQAIADAAHDPQVLAAFRSFVDQQGVPVVDLHRTGAGLTATQSRYAYLGSKPQPETWTIPLCVRVGADKNCSLLGPQPATIVAPVGATVMPNAGGTGYYRFNLDPADWQALIRSSAQLPAGEALATTDSLWAAFRAGKAPASLLIDEGRAMSANPSSIASIDPAQRLSSVYRAGLIPASSEQAYRSLIGSIYAPRLASLGFDPAAGAHAADAPDRQKLRQQLVSLLAIDARDPAIRSKLKAAAEQYLGGNTKALEPGFLEAGLAVWAQEGGMPAVCKLVDTALSSEDATLRQEAISAAASTGDPATVPYLLDLQDKRLRSYDRLFLVFGLAGTAQTKDAAADWIFANYAKLAGGNGVFFGSRLPGALGLQCSTEAAQRIEQTLEPAVAKANTGMLEFKRTLERIRNCAILKQAKQAEIAAAINGH